MKIKFETSLEQWKRLNKYEIFMHYTSFSDFMCMYEERMTFREAERYWKKFEGLEKYIKEKYNYDPEQLMRDFYFTKKIDARGLFELLK